MEKNKIIKVANRNSSKVGYKIPELNIERQFMPRETKDTITFQELESLSFLPGGLKMLKDYLIVKDPEALKELGINVEPEYYYNENDVKRILTQGTLNEFLDCLDFAPDGVLDMIKDLSVSLPLNDMSKREAILNKMNFDVTKAIEIKNTKFDGDNNSNLNNKDSNNSNNNPIRRASVPVTENTPQRREINVPKYTVV